MGAVATTFIAGVEAIRRGISQAHRLADADGDHPPRQAHRQPRRRSSRSSSRWPSSTTSCSAAGTCSPTTPTRRRARRACCRRSTSTQLKDFLSTIKPMTAVFEQDYVKKLTATHAKKGKTKADLAEQVIDDIKDFKKKNNCDRLVMVWCGSTEVYRKPAPVPRDAGRLREGPGGERSGDLAVADLRVRGAEAGRPLRQRRAQPDRRHAGADGAGQAEQRPDRRQGLQDRPDADEDDPRARLQGAPAGRRGLVLDEHPRQPRRRGARRSRSRSRPRRSRSSASLEHILQPHLYPDLYGDMHHVVRINYYPPRGDNKEGWDNIDIFGWMGYPMQIKIDFLCRDSILAAPIVLDLALFMDLAQRCGMSGIQEWLSFYWKSPQTRARPLPRARPLHPADEAEEHAPPPARRGADHAPRRRVLRLATLALNSSAGAGGAAVRSSFASTLGIPSRGTIQPRA